MITVSQFYEMVMLNEWHILEIKSHDTDAKIDGIIRVEHLENSPYKDYEIKHFATDWNKRVYILWV